MNERTSEAADAAMIICVFLVTRLNKRHYGGGQSVGDWGEKLRVLGLRPNEEMSGSLQSTAEVPLGIFSQALKFFNFGVG